MKLLNSKFNLDDLVKINPNAEVWYKNNFPQNTHMFKIVENTCREKFVVFDVAKFLRSGGTHLYVQKISELSIDPNADYVIFVLDKNGRCADEKLCWYKFDEPLFVKDK